MNVLVATSDHPFYLWQVLVQIEHFRERGTLSGAHWLLYHQGEYPSPLAKRIARETNANFHFWRDVRRVKEYDPAMKPWLLGAYFRDHPEDVGKRFQYIDPDVMVIQEPEFYDEIPAWSASCTDSYTGPGYLRSHGENLWRDLCAIAGADACAAEKVLGVGAQWIIQDADADFWFDVSVASEQMWLRCKAQPRAEGQQYQVQAWCAEMYATQLLALAYGFPVRSDPAMSFLWANGEVSEWDDHGYFHDAGVNTENGRDFCKISHQSSPFRTPLAVNPASASSRYVDLIRRTVSTYPSVLW